MTAGPERVVITGAAGALGSQLLVELAGSMPDAQLIGVFSGGQSRDALIGRAPADVAAALTARVCDLTDADQVTTLTQALIRPPGRSSAGSSAHPPVRTVVVHAAANTRWDATESDAGRANVEATRHVATLCRAIGARLVLVSSAYTARQAWQYRNVYEATKAQAERLVLTEFVDLDPVVFSCSLVLGHSGTGQISRFHGIYPIFSLIDRHQPAVLPGRADGLVDIVPVDWVAQELALLVGDLLAGRAGGDVVAAAGSAGSPTLAELVSGVAMALNRVRLSQGRPQFGEPLVVPFRRWDFLRRSARAWNLEDDVDAGERLDQVVALYRPYFEDAHAQEPVGLRRSSPPWRNYLDVVVDHWARQRAARTTVAG